MIRKVQEDSRIVQDFDKMREIKEQIGHVWQREEAYWFQRSRVNWLNLGEMSKEVSCTDVVLIPKQSGPELVSHFRPISLCNFMNKIITRVMVNRLKPLLGELITENQSAFVARRQIHDNIMVA